MTVEDLSEFRGRSDMCGVYAVQSVIGTLLNDNRFQAPLWVWNSRKRFIERNKLFGIPRTPNDKKEYKWVKATLEKLRGETTIPLRSIDLQRITDTPELTAAVSGGIEVIMFGTSNNYRVPHMYHLGHYVHDRFGKRFQSLQQTTPLIDLSDFFMRKGECNAIFIL